MDACSNNVNIVSTIIYASGIYLIGSVISFSIIALFAYTGPAAAARERALPINCGEDSDCKEAVGAGGEDSAREEAEEDDEDGEDGEDGEAEEEAEEEAEGDDDCPEIEEASDDEEESSVDADYSVVDKTDPEIEAAVAAAAAKKHINRINNVIEIIEPELSLEIMKDYKNNLKNIIKSLEDISDPTVYEVVKLDFAKSYLEKRIQKIITANNYTNVTFGDVYYPIPGNSNNSIGIWQELILDILDAHN